ncbi:macrophage mannose receptor 1-like [Labrus mixtus]|uniref:macrophage mannose receptor 1-like n=1 Tax=Labrus mixtus TaxID=508554 RepID=UPI0029C0E253|nr:macrophage mannose receptor 1-like [Labrus mixtus]
MRITCTAFLLLIQTLQCLALDDSPFQLSNKATGFCLVKTNNFCNEIRWTTGDRLLVHQRKKCLGVQGKSVGSEISLYDCDENSELQKWECKNGTVLALRDQELYIELTADNTAVLSRTVGSKSYLTISGGSSGACTRTYRELYSIGGNAVGMPCMFPFQYKDQWYSDCTTTDSPENQLWCAVETKYQSERWGYCPVTSKGYWNIHPTTGAYYQLNTQSALTWPQAETSCQQQGASLLSITDPHEQAYVTALLGSGGNKLWTGLILDPGHSWKWSNGRPYRYMKWDSGHPLPDPGHNCAMVDPAVRYSWQSFPCSKKLGYICYSKASEVQTVKVVETGFCSSPWIPYNGHCFSLNRTEKTWPEAQRDCRIRGGDLVSIHSVEDQSFVISQLGFASTDELWIGLNDRKTEKLFDWVDHSTVSFTSWEFGKPAVSTDINDCVLMRGETGNWADRACEERHGFICMKLSSTKATEDEVVMDEGCRTGWRRHGSYCYFTGTQSKTFDEAVDDCKSYNSYLADVSNGVDNAFLVSLLGWRSEKHFWLGLSNQKNIDEFVWTNTDTVRFTYWNAHMPGSGQGCVAMTTGIFAGLWDLLPCTKSEKYICKHLAEGAVITPAPPIPTTPPKCPPEWELLKTRNYCYKAFKDSSAGRTWYEARDYCKAIGGDLLSIHSEDELMSIIRHSHIRYSSVWIGLSAPDPGTGYLWSDGSPLQFQHWEDNEPNNKNNVESCVQFLFYLRGSWSDVHCETELAWMCQIQTGLTPNPSPDPVRPAYNRTLDGWLEWNGNQYYISRYSLAMEDARSLCKRMHSDLVTINSEAESIFLWKRIYSSSNSFWIGLTVDLDRTYGWMDGSPVVFLRWDEGQPRFQNNDENCAVMRSSMGFWHDSNCGFEYSFICKRNDTPPAHVTVPPTVPPKGGCPLNWKKMDSKCYTIINKERETWDGARTQCIAMGGNLASINSRHVQVFLTTLLAEAPTTDLWIGLHNKNGHLFYWTDGLSRRYFNWNNEWHYQSFSDHLYNHDQSVFQPKECVVMTSVSTKELGKWTKKSCNDTNGYVCLRSVDPSLPDSPQPTTPNYVNIFNDSVKVITRKMTWYSAQKNCKDDGATLASLRNIWSKTYIDLITLNLNAPVWIGLNKLETGGYFRYTEGWHLNSNYWDAGEPRSDRPCVYVNVDGKWRTSECDGTMASVCMKSTDVPPTEQSEFPGICPDVQEQLQFRRQLYTWLPFKGNCYLFWPQRCSWPDASANCAAYGGSLVSIEDPSEQVFIHRQIQVYDDSQRSYWIGLYKTHRGQWLWLDKAAMDYTNWDLGEPYEKRYGVIRVSDGRWITTRNDHTGYICKTPKVILQQAPSSVGSPVVTPQSNGSLIMPVVLVICATALVILIVVIVLLLVKKSGRFSVPMSSAFHNPIFFNRTQSQPNLVDANEVEGNVEGEIPEAGITL